MNVKYMHVLSYEDDLCLLYVYRCLRQSGAQSPLKSWGEPRFGSKVGWVFGAGGGRPLPLWEYGVWLPGNFWKLRC